MTTNRNKAVYEEALAVSEGEVLASESLWPAEFPPSAEAPVDSWRYRYVKRSFDLVCTLVMIAVFAIPGLLIAITILLNSKGPIFYRERRIGRYGRPFRIWKFRSMHRNGGEQVCIPEVQSSGKVVEWRMRKHLQDPRITSVGGFLRRWSLDELPQLFNVLRGEMSLIGPRPIIEAETEFYGDLLSFYLAATPGLSGLWQVSGRSHIDYDKRAKLDASYVQSWSLGRDFSILLRTVPVVLGQVGAR